MSFTRTARRKNVLLINVLSQRIKNIAANKKKISEPKKNGETVVLTNPHVVMTQAFTTKENRDRTGIKFCRKILMCWYGKKDCG